MKLMAVIRGRFARLLLRLAQRLDSGLAAAPVLVMPDQMTLLRQRYAGAPQHWLEAVARRMAVGETSEAMHPAPPPVPAFDRTLRRAAAAEARFDDGLPVRTDGPGPRFAARPPRPADRPRPRFASAARFERPALRFSPGDRGVIERQSLHLAPDRRRRRPVLTFRTAGARMRHSEPAIAPREQTPRPQPIFSPASDERPPHRELNAQSDCAGTRARHPVDFAPLPEPQVDWPDGPLSDLPPGERPRPHFPDLPFRTSAPHFEWRASPGTARAEPAFPSSFPDWPELPSLAEEEGLAAPRSDEAALACEQMVGRWSA